MIPAPHPVIPLAILGAIVLAFASRSLWVRRAIGRSPLVFGRSDDAHDHLGRVFRVGSLVVFAWFAARVAWPQADAHGGAVVWLARPVVAWAGIAVMAAGGALVVAAQVQMGVSWRIGIDAEPTKLVGRGLFRRSRNPVFLGLLVVLAGGLLAAPSAVTVALMAGGWVALSAQVRLEEAGLQALHGEAYTRYRREVRRWL